MGGGRWRLRLRLRGGEVGWIKSEDGDSFPSDACQILPVFF